MLSFVDRVLNLSNRSLIRIGLVNFGSLRDRVSLNLPVHITPYAFEWVCGCLGCQFFAM